MINLFKELQKKISVTMGNLDITMKDGKPHNSVLNCRKDLEHASENLELLIKLHSDKDFSLWNFANTYEELKEKRLLEEDKESAVFSPKEDSMMNAIKWVN